MTQRHISRDGVQQRTVEQIVDAPVPQTLKELTEVSKVFSQDRIQQRVVEQTIEDPAIPLVEKTVEMPVIRTKEKTQHVVNTHVQHVVNTVEVLKWRGPNSSKRHSAERSPSSMRKSTR